MDWKVVIEGASYQTTNRRPGPAAGSPGVEGAQPETAVVGIRLLHHPQRVGRGSRLARDRGQRPIEQALDGRDAALSDCEARRCSQTARADAAARGGREADQLLIAPTGRARDEGRQA